jgi:hypothetical protein
MVPVAWPPTQPGLSCRGVILRLHFAVLGNAERDTDALRYFSDDRVAETLIRVWIASGHYGKAAAVVGARRDAAMEAGRRGHVIAADALGAVNCQAQGDRRGGVPQR